MAIKLPELPYALDALAPQISANISISLVKTSLHRCT